MDIYHDSLVPWVYECAIPGVTMEFYETFPARHFLMKKKYAQCLANTDDSISTSEGVS